MVLAATLEGVGGLLGRCLDATAAARFEIYVFSIAKGGSIAGLRLQNSSYNGIIMQERHVEANIMVGFGTDAFIFE